MKTIKWSDSGDVREVQQAIVAVLEQGGLVCLPCGGKYRLLADFTNETAVLHLMQSKGRMHKAPALIFIADETRLAEIAETVDPVALRLARELWPQPLTIRVTPSPELPPKVLKQLGGSKSRIGVRVPSEPLMRAVVEAANRPLLASSANKEARAGDGSPAQVRKSFAPHVDLFVDQGDLRPLPPSTVVDVRDGEVVIERAGAVTEQSIRALTAG
jgi:L-threonylcarbamoyladenylate synthase